MIISMLTTANMGEKERESLLTHPGSRRLLSSDITWRGLAQEGLKA